MENQPKNGTNPEPPDSGDRARQLTAALRLFTHRVPRYGFAVVAVGIACLLRVALGDALGAKLAYVTFYPAIMVAALLGGIGPGVLATALSALYAAIWVLPPVGFLAISSTADAIGLATFGCMGFFMSMVAGLFNKASAKVADYEREQARFAGPQPAASAPDRSPAATHDFKKRVVFDSMLGLVLAILLSVGWLAYRDMTAATEADRWATHTYLVIDELLRLESGLKDAETGERGFLITGDDKYLDPYRASLGEIETHLAVLRQLTADNASQQQRLAAITPLVAAKLAELKATIALRQSKGLEAASQAVMAHLGNNIMARLRALLDETRQEEERLLQDRSAAKENDSSNTVRSVLLGGTLGGLALVLLFLSLKLELARRQRAESELRGHRDHLERLVAARTRDLDQANRELQNEVDVTDHALAELRESEGKLRLFSEHAPAAIAMLDAQMRYIATSRRWLADYGLEGRDLRGLSHYEVFPEISDRWKDIHRRCLAGASDRSEEDRFNRPDGSSQWLRWEIHPWHVAAGAVGGIIIFSEDITDRKARDTELRRLNRTLEALNSSSHAMSRAEREQDYLEEVCSIVVEKCGHSMVWVGFAGEDEGRSVRPVAHAGFEEGYIETLNISWADTDRGRGPTGTAIRTGKACACRQMLTDPAFAPWREEAFRRGYASSLALPLIAGERAFGALTLYSREPDGFSEEEVALLAQLASDLASGIGTIRLRGELRLQGAALQSAANAIAITDRNGVVQWVNDAFTQLTGYSFAEAIGQNPRVLKSGMHEPEFYKNMWGTVLAGRVWHGTLINKRKDGTLYSEEMTITPVKEEGAITHYIAIKQDITVRKRAEEEIQKLNAELTERVRLRTLALQVSNQELEAFCYSVSHDLRAPLRGINGFSQALQDDYADRLDETGTKYLDRIRAACQRMGQLIDDLLKLSRLSRSEMRWCQVDLSGMALEVADELRESAPERAVQFHIADGVTSVGDHALLRVAIENLMGNAFKFTAKGAGAVIEFGARQGGRGVYFVRDNGAGFDPAYADKLFQPFQRLHAVTEFPGTGIGLATVARVIGRHGGRVWAEAAPGEGATFYFTLQPETEQNG